MQGLKVLVGLALAGGLLVAAGPARAHDGCDNDRGGRYDGPRSGRVLYRNVGYREYDGRYGRSDGRYDYYESDRARREALDRRDRLERERDRDCNSRYDRDRFQERLDRERARDYRWRDSRYDADRHRSYGDRDCR
jgi:hypothetical protein